MACCSSCGFATCRCGGHFTTLEGPEIGRTLVASLNCVADEVRDLYTCLGARPYHVELVWTRWSGGERGVGVEEVIRTERLLPTPKIAELTSLSRGLQPIGVDEVGSIRVSELSPRYTEDFLIGQSPDGTPIPDDQQFFWEVFFPRADGPGMRRRFTPRSAPSLDATKFQWVITLARASEDRSRSGALP